MNNPLKTLGANLLGKDYVIGDLHGSYSVFENLLKNINFNPLTDRIISVGDLTDRGPESLKCLGLLREPWFHAVLSNHEQMMLHKFFGGFMGMYWYQNGGEWGMEAYNDFVATKTLSTRVPQDSSSELFDLLELTKELPFLITVTTAAQKKFHILHAELPARGGTITDTELADPVTVFRLATIQRGDGDAFLWSRNIFANFYCRDLDERDEILADIKNNNSDRIFNDRLSHIISGHTILQQPMTIIGQTNIDTGAYCSYSGDDTYFEDWAALTCIDLNEWKFYQATESAFKEVTPFVADMDDINNLKSIY